ncbi:hypothetical protein [Nonomuraea sp. NPDC048916]
MSSVAVLWGLLVRSPQAAGGLSAAAWLAGAGVVAVPIAAVLFRRRTTA